MNQLEHLLSVTADNSAFVGDYFQQRESLWQQDVVCGIESEYL